MPANRTRKSKIAQGILSLHELTAGLAFIGDDILRENIVLTIQHIYFLIAVVDEAEVENTAVANGLYKDVILHCAAVIEGCLHHALRFCFDSGLAKSSEVMPTGWKDAKTVKLHDISDLERVCGVVQIKKNEELVRITNFQTVHRACRKVGILSEYLEGRVSMIREARNNIHLAGLRSVDNAYSKRDAQRAVTLMTAVLKKVRDKTAIR